MNGQATLTVQGTIQKASGANLDDGSYSMSFRLYTAARGGVPIWSETQEKVDVTGGVYGVLLGTVAPLNIPFDRPYFLGVSVDRGAELAPRIRLTASPYSLSLVGQNNLFPSTGAVGMGTIQPDTSTHLHVKDTSGVSRVLLEGKDSSVVVFKTRSNTSTMVFDGDQLSIPDAHLELSGGISLPAGQSVKYNNLPSWRLVEVDDFSTGVEGWSCIRDITNSTPVNFERFSPNTPFSSGFILRPTEQVNGGSGKFVKEFDLSGIPHTLVKVVFLYHFFGTWDVERVIPQAEHGLGWFSTKKAPWEGSPPGIIECKWQLTPPYNLLSFYNSLRAPGGAGLYSIPGEMVAQTTDDKFWVIFGAFLDQGPTDENYGISNIQIWVR